MRAVDVLRLLAESYDQHARASIPDRRCGCDLCCWIETVPGVLEAIAAIDLPGARP